MELEGIESGSSLYLFGSDKYCSCNDEDGETEGDGGYVECPWAFMPASEEALYGYGV
jgi:hypothetical protein